MTALVLLFFLVCFVVPLHAVTTVANMVVLEGRSITVPCHYEPQHALNVKYWCWGSMKTSCSVLARTDSTSSRQDGEVTIVDDRSQWVFTVTMREPKEADSGWYWCGVELGGIWKADEMAFIHITVQHGVSAVKSMVSGEEGDGVTVQCLYSEGHRHSVKMWCRTGDRNSCLVTDSDGNYESTSVRIHDDKEGAFAVTVMKLEEKDSGWYWCAAGGQHVPVHVQVEPRHATALGFLWTTPSSVSTLLDKRLFPNTHLAKECSPHRRSLWESLLMACGVLFLLVIAVMVPWKIWDLQKKRHTRRNLIEEQSPSLHVCSGGDRNWQNASLLFLNSPEKVQVV